MSRAYGLLYVRRPGEAPGGGYNRKKVDFFILERIQEMLQAYIRLAAFEHRQCVLLCSIAFCLILLSVNESSRVDAGRLTVTAKLI